MHSPILKLILIAIAFISAGISPFIEVRDAQKRLTTKGKILFLLFLISIGVTIVIEWSHIGESNKAAKEENDRFDSIQHNFRDNLTTLSLISDSLKKLRQLTSANFTEDQEKIKEQLLIIDNMQKVVAQISTKSILQLNELAKANKQLNQINYPLLPIKVFLVIGVPTVKNFTKIITKECGVPHEGIAINFKDNQRPKLNDADIFVRYQWDSLKYIEENFDPEIYPILLPSMQIILSDSGTAGMNVKSVHDKYQIAGASLKRIIWSKDTTFFEFQDLEITNYLIPSTITSLLDFNKTDLLSFIQFTFPTQYLSEDPTKEIYISRLEIAFGETAPYILYYTPVFHPNLKKIPYRNFNRYTFFFHKQINSILNLHKVQTPSALNKP